jgi:hypothetical protein
MGSVASCSASLHGFRGKATPDQALQRTAGSRLASMAYREALR